MLISQLRSQVRNLLEDTSNIFTDTIIDFSASTAISDIKASTQCNITSQITANLSAGTSDIKLSGLTSNIWTVSIIYEDVVYQGLRIPAEVPVDFSETTTGYYYNILPAKYDNINFGAENGVIVKLLNPPDKEFSIIITGPINSGGLSYAYAESHIVLPEELSKALVFGTAAYCLLTSRDGADERQGRIFMEIMRTQIEQYEQFNIIRYGQLLTQHLTNSSITLP